MSAGSSPFVQRKSSEKAPPLKVVVMRSLPPMPDVPTFQQFDSALEGKDMIKLIIEHCVCTWQLNDDYEEYSLKIQDPKNYANTLITDENTDLLYLRGIVLKLCYSTRRHVIDMIKNLTTYDKGAIFGMEDLLQFLGYKDPTTLDSNFFLCFTQEFDGVSVALKRLLYEMAKMESMPENPSPDFYK